MSDLPLPLAVIAFTVFVAVGLCRMCLQLSRRSEELHAQFGKKPAAQPDHRMAA